MRPGPPGPVLTGPGGSAALPVMAKPTGAGLQPGLRAVLLPVEGDAVSGQPVPDGRGPAGGLSPPADRGARAVPRGGGRLAGRRAHHDGLDFFRRSIELERKYAAPGQRVLNTIQTNGSQLDDEWGRFPHTRHYQVTSTGLRHALFLTRVHDRILQTGFRARPSHRAASHETGTPGQARAGGHDLPNSSQYGNSSHPPSRMRAVSGASELALHLWAILGSNQ